MKDSNKLDFFEAQSDDALSKLALTTSTKTLLQRFEQWVYNKSAVPFLFSTACCSLEYSWQYQTVNYEEDFSTEIIPPAESDLLLIGGTINLKTYPLLKEVYHKMPKKKWVVVVGSCPLSGGPFNSFNVVSDISKDIPVDIFIPGCPPTPNDIKNGMKLLADRIQNGVMACASH